MAYFRGYVKGNRGFSSRLGSRDSGIQSHVHSGKLGIQVYGELRDGKDVFTVYLVSGGIYPQKKIRLLAIDADDPLFQKILE